MKVAIHRRTNPTEIHSKLNTWVGKFQAIFQFIIYSVIISVFSRFIKSKCLFWIIDSNIFAGFKSRDTVCFAGVCAKDVVFVEMNKTLDLQNGMHGILGLASTLHRNQTVWNKYICWYLLWKEGRILALSQT